LMWSIRARVYVCVCVKEGEKTRSKQDFCVDEFYTHVCERDRDRDRRRERGREGDLFEY